jgi:hypothetical protein
MVWITAFVSERMLAFKQQLARMGNAVEIYRIEPAAAKGGDAHDRAAGPAPESRAAGAH